MLKNNKSRTILLITALLPSYGYTSCILNDNAYLCSGNDSETQEIVNSTENLSVTIEDGYTLNTSSGNSLYIDSGAKVVNVTSTGKSSISSSDGTVIDITASGEGNAINAKIFADIDSVNNGDGIVLNSNGDGGVINLDYAGNMNVNTIGIIAYTEDNSTVKINLDGEVGASYAINSKIGDNSSIAVVNNADMNLVDGITDSKLADNSSFSFLNNGDIVSTGKAFDVFAGDNSTVNIANNKKILSDGASLIRLGKASTFNLDNTGDITSTNMGFRFDFGDNVNLHIDNKGTIRGQDALLIYTSSSFVDGTEGNISIINSGLISGENSALALNGAWANYYIENSGAITTGTGINAIDVSDQKSFALALKQGWEIDGRVNIAPDRFGGLTDSKVILAGDGDSAITLSRFQGENTSSDTDAIVGINYLEKQGLSTWTLTGTQTSGQFETVDIQQGGILLDDATLLTKTLTNSANIYVKNHAVIDGDVLNSGAVHINNTQSNQAGNTLLINGNYTGEKGSHVIYNSVLNDDSSPTDQLIINGDTSGSSLVTVNNLGGYGAQTVEGIKLISVAGDSAGTFMKNGRIVSGAYDYSLVRGTNGQEKNWYLTSKFIPKNENVIRPEAGSYIANIAAANTLFNTRLHDRLGETQYVDALTGEDKVTSLWLRQVGSHNNWRDSSGQLKTQSNSYVVQLGGDIAQWTSNGLNRGHLGLMSGYANSRNNTHSSASGYTSKGSLNGYSVGAYGSWFANDVDKSGLYVDSWLQYNWFNNHVNGEQLASESYRSKGVTASIETGYTAKMGEFSGSKGSLNEWYIQPQAQATWMGVKADDHHERNGSNVSSEGDGNLQTRLGVRAFLKSHHAMDEGKDRSFEPFIEANWLHNTRDYSAKMDDIRVSQAGARNLGEVKVGVEGQLTRHLNLWGNVGVQVGDQGYNNSSAMIGAKYNF
ncbi:autotransporter outer membrane beta-barrel domain-containing protein [Kluyvera genomosp. 1]|uniref:autotransporter outer membrane beta-barrel domain-containing protein n=1 Tax=Kluyvera genomosp. 1 TaxID=2774053 RepID=UPI0009E4B23D|nr:autotransporter outer membrane beta-barrel domain-containing protein [Kluyvera genomosp. 1]